MRAVVCGHSALDAKSFAGTFDTNLACPPEKVLGVSIRLRSSSELAIIPRPARQRATKRKLRAHIFVLRLHERPPPKLFAALANSLKRRPCESGIIHHIR